MSDTPAAPLIDLNKTVAAMQADAADPSPGAPLPPQVQPEPTATTTEPVPAAKRGRGRPPGSGAKRGAGGKFAPKSATTAPATENAPAGEIRPMTPYESAAMVNGLMFGIVAVIGGDEARPTEQEATLCNGALGEYLALHPEFAIRPEFMLAAVYLPYFGRALTRPTAREKLSIVGGRAWSAIKSIFKKKEQPANVATPAA